MKKSRLLSGKTVLITGGTSGIGFFTARELARMDATLYITGRNADRGKEAEHRIRESAGHSRIFFVQSDASTVGGNEELAQRITARTDQLHILMNNVGGLYNDRWQTRDGYEASLAMNFIGPFALTESLLPLLERNAPARIVNVTSAGYQMWRGDLFADIHSLTGYVGSNAYNRAKYLNLLWTFALARRMRNNGVVANALHPGVAWTTMTQSNQPRILPSGMRWLWPLFRLIQRVSPPARGARTSVYLASAPETGEITAHYFQNSTKARNPGPKLLDENLQERAWELATALVRTAPTAVANTRPIPLKTQ